MSFILESIKQAERDRKLGQVPSISVEYSSSNNEIIETSWMKWAIVSIGFIIVAVAIWLGMKALVGGELYLTSNYAENKSIEDKPKRLNKEITVPDEQRFVVVQKDSQNASSTHSADQDVNDSRDIFSYTPSQNLRNSQLKSVRVINQQEQEPQLVIVDKRTEVSKQEAIKPIQVAQVANIESDKTPAINHNKELQLQTSQEKVKEISPREKLASLYSDLAVVDRSEPITENGPIDKQARANITLNDHEPVTLVSMDVAPQINVAPKIRKAVNTGVSDFGELPYDIQEKIPDLGISVHMFNEEDPTQRRVRINGRMYTEGASLQRDMALVEITRYGVIFDYQGHVFRLNVR